MFASLLVLSCVPLKRYLTYRLRANLSVVGVFALDAVERCPDLRNIPPHRG